LQTLISKDLSMYIAKEEQVAVVDHQTIATLLDKSSPGFNKPALLSIAEKLEADFLVLGSITKIGENISLDTYLLNTRGTPSFTKDFTEGKNLTVLLNKMGTKISSQVLQVVSSYQELQETEEQIVFKKPEETKPVEPAAVAGSELPEFESRDEEDLEAPAVVYAETDELEPAAPAQAPDSEAGDDQPSETPAIAESGEEFIEEIQQEAPPVAVPEEEVVEAPEVVYAETDELESAAPVQVLDSEAGDDQPSETPAIAESGEEFIEEIQQEAPPLAVPEEDRPEAVIWPETEDEEDKAATVALLPKTEREEIDRAEQEPADKSFSSPFSTVKPVKITSKSMEADNKRNMVTFKGNVIVKQEDIVISSDLMKVSYEPKGGINKVEASGNVKMSQENRIATGKKLIFFNPEQKIVMTGKPKIWQGDNLISCEKVTVLLEEDKIFFEGKVDSIIYPRSMQEEPKEKKQQVEEITTPGREAEAVVEQEGYSPEE
jgi:lipopolysaccharide export system protein LptA